MAGSTGFNSEDLAAAIMAGSHEAMMWYALTHDKELPGAGGIMVQTPFVNASVGSSSTLLIVGVLVIGAILIFSSR